MSIPKRFNYTRLRVWTVQGDLFIVVSQNHHEIDPRSKRDLGRRIAASRGAVFN